MGYAPGLAFLGTVTLRVLWGLAQVLVQVSTVKILTYVVARESGTNS